MQVYRGATVPRDKLQEVTGLQVGTGAADTSEAAVFLGEGVAFEVGAVLDRWQTVLGRQAFESCVGDDLVGRGAAGDCGQDAERVFEAQAEFAVGGVHQRVGTGLHLGDAVKCRADIIIPGARGAADRTFESGAFNIGAGVDQALDAFVRAGFAGRLVFEVDDMAFVPHYAAETEIFSFVHCAG